MPLPKSDQERPQDKPAPRVPCAESDFDMAVSTGTIRQHEENFRLSRVQAEGWSAAHIYLRQGDPYDDKAIAALNPHKTQAERVRWFAGFNNALDKV